MIWVPSLYQKEKRKAGRAGKSISEGAVRGERERIRPMENFRKISVKIDERHASVVPEIAEPHAVPVIH